MPARRGAGATHRINGADARRIDQLGGKVDFLATPEIKPPQGSPAGTRAASDAPIAFAVIYETTDDNFDGSPWPPDGNDFWCVVASANGSTRWRRIALTPITAPGRIPGQSKTEKSAWLLRPHYPDEHEEVLRDRTISMRADRYANGRWPTDEEIEAKKAKKAKDAEKAAAEKTAAEIISFFHPSPAPTT